MVVRMAELPRSSMHGIRRDVSSATLLTPIPTRRLEEAGCTRTPVTIVRGRCSTIPGMGSCTSQVPRTKCGCTASPAGTVGNGIGLRVFCSAYKGTHRTARRDLPHKALSAEVLSTRQPAGLRPMRRSAVAAKDQVRESVRLLHPGAPAPARWLSPIRGVSPSDQVGRVRPEAAAPDQCKTTKVF
jgi:hypothetical protein